jgi:RimJ/RimL family protein N-acetyltransferase
VLRSWPVSGIRVTTPLVELRWPSMEDLDELAWRGAQGVHSPEFMPFFSAWTDGDEETVAQRVIQRHWAALGGWKPAEWTLYLVVAYEGGVVGSQSIGARNYATTREVLLTSWLGQAFQGKGIGAHARGAMLHLAFEGLAADYAFSVVRRENVQSQAICKRFGFVLDGMQINSVRGEQAISDRFRLDRHTWVGNRLEGVTMAGVEAGLTLFGLRESPGGGPAGLIDPPPELLSGVQFAPEADGMA